MVKEILNQWSSSNYCDLHLTISVRHAEIKDVSKSNFMDKLNETLGIKDQGAAHW